MIDGLLLAAIQLVEEAIFLHEGDEMRLYLAAHLCFSLLHELAMCLEKLLANLEALTDLGWCLPEGLFCKFGEV